MTQNDPQSEALSPGGVCVSLVGYRGAGKSAVGQRIAAITGGVHVDTDAMIAAKAGRSIKEIFQFDGEESFRRMEEELLSEAIARDPAVVSVGGGAVESKRNRDLLASGTFVVWLTAPADILWQRICDDGSTARSRPPLTSLEGLEEVRTMLIKRDPLYRQVARRIIDTSERTPDAIARLVHCHSLILG